jgi:3'-5' exonuclease
MNVLRNVDLTRIFFIDIETAPGRASFADHDTRFQQLWTTFSAKRHAKELEAGQTAADLFDRAGLYAEFGQVVCISVGFFRPETDGGFQFHVKSFASTDERAVLRGFAALLADRRPFGTKLAQATTRTTGDSRDCGHYLCAHNGREFDYAYLGRRMLITGIPLPPMLDISGYKPWELPHLLDTMDLWKFGDNKGYTSLNLLAGVFNIPSPKDDIDGSQVGGVFWAEGQAGVMRIATYCEKDIITTARIYLHYAGLAAHWDDARVVHRPLDGGVPDAI